ncbi:MAG: M55 family metallopeptidase, partial [Sedimentisphaerales bacterium]
PVKKGIGAAALNLHPEKSRELIKEGVKKALGRLSDFKPFELTGPYKIEVTYKNEEKVYKAALWPGATRTGDWTATYTSNQFLDIMKFLELNY